MHLKTIDPHRKIELSNTIHKYEYSDVNYEDELLSSNKQWKGVIFFDMKRIRHRERKLQKENYLAKFPLRLAN